MNAKLCNKGGYHSGRLIEALCLQPNCSSDRLLCFYCKHQSHRDHQTAYFPKGLNASLQNINQNSRLENSSKEKRKIDKKLSTIKKGWQNIEQTLNNYQKQIYNQLNQSFQTVYNTFSKNSVLQIKQKLSIQQLPSQQVQKYVKMINTVSKYQLNDSKKIMIFMKIKQRILNEVFRAAADQINDLMKQLQAKSWYFDFTSVELDKYIQNQLDQNQFQNNNCESFQFLDEPTNENQFKSYMTTSLIQSQNSLSQISQVFQINRSKQIQEISQHSIQSIEKAHQAIDSTNVSKQANEVFSFPQKNLKIKIGKSILQMAKNLQIAQGKQFKQRQKQNENLKIIDLDQLSQLNYQIVEDEQIKQLSKCRKKTKNNLQFDYQKINTFEQLQELRKKEFNKRIINTFEENSNSFNYQVQDDQQSPSKYNNKNLQKQYYSQRIQIQRYKDQKRKAITQVKKYISPLHEIKQKQQIIMKQPKKKQQLQKNLYKNVYLTIQKGKIILPQMFNDPKLQKQNVKSKHFIIPNVKIIGNNEFDVLQNLKLINTNIVQKLQIYSDSTICCVDFQCIDVISKMEKLTSLNIYMAHKLDRQEVKRLIMNLPNLQELVLSLFNILDLDLAQTIKKCLPKLKRFYYSVDYKNYMQKMQQNFEFFIDITPNPTNIQALQVLAQIAELQTVELINLQKRRLHQVPAILCKMKNLKEITITITNTTKNQFDFQQIIREISQTRKNLTVLCLHNICFKQIHLIQIFKKNKNLNTLILNECLQLQNSTMQTLLQNCKNLEQLSLMLTDSIHGKQIYSCTNLRTLILRGCWRIDNTFFCNNIHKLKNLECLSVSMNCYWFYDNLMKQIVKLSKLKILNIDTTKISDIGIQQIYKLGNLQTLICGKTQISFQGLLKSLIHPENGVKNYNIRKLGLAKDKGYMNQIKKKKNKNKHDIIMKDFHAKNLLPLGKSLPNLTHLSIGGIINPQKKYFQTLTNLKCLSIRKHQLEAKTQKIFQKKGIYLNLQHD